MSEQFDEYDRYALFDIETHTIDALELVLEKMRQARERPTSWKWVVIGLHTAMHGGFALVLRRSDGAQLLDKKREQAVYESWERERETGTRESLHYDHLDWFLQLYEKTKDPSRMNYLGGLRLSRPSIRRKRYLDSTTTVDRSCTSRQHPGQYRSSTFSI